MGTRLSGIKKLDHGKKFHVLIDYDVDGGMEIALSTDSLAEAVQAALDPSSHTGGTAVVQVVEIESDDDV